MNCPFCDPEIIKSQTLYENKTVRVIHNIRPVNKGQCIVVPKRHVTNIRELNKQELVDLITTVQMVSQKYQEYLNPVGFNYGFNEGHYSGQRVGHFHFHIIPRIEGDKSKLPEYHLFHRDLKTVKDLSTEQLKPLVDEIKTLFS